MSKLNKNYLSSTFLIMLIGWGICLLCSFNGTSLNDNRWVPYLLVGWSPTIASYLSLGSNNKVSDIKEWLKNIFDFRQNIFSYLMVVIMAIIFILPQQLYFWVRKRSTYLCDYYYDSYDVCWRWVRRSGLTLYSSAGIREKVFIHYINDYSQYYLVVVAFAFVLHTRSGSIWAKLFRIWNKHIRIKLCFGKYKKKYEQCMALCIISLHCKFFIGDLCHQ